MNLGEFLSREAGQKRRAWLDAQAQKPFDALREYLGGTGVPERVEAAVTLADYLNPVSDIGRAGQSAQTVFDPNATGRERFDAGVSMATDMAAVLAPAAAAKMVGGDGARAVAEALANVTMPADDAVQRFALADDGAIRAWHGSPHDFDRFSMDKIGTGEGAQAYGHGLYFAESPGVAKSYRDVLSGDVSSIGDMAVNTTRSPDDAISAWRQASAHLPKDVQDAVSYKLGQRLGAREILDDLDVDFYGEFNDEVAKILRSHPGRLYEVNINANPEDFLDWDKPLSEQPQKVRDALTGIYPDDMMGGDIARLMATDARDTAIMRGDDAATSLGASQAAASEGMRELGIPGIRYLDAGSRGAGDGSRNYVVFDDRLIDILGKDGARNTPEGRAQNVLDMLASGRGAEVTDDMLDLGDPVQNARLNQYLFSNYDLPMDEASRMARAREMGFDTEAFHATRSAENFSAFDPGWRGSTYFAATPRDAASGALGGAQDFSQVDLGGTKAIIPVRLPGDEVARLRPSRQQWDALPDRAFVHNENELAQSVGARYSDDVYDTSFTESGDIRIEKRPYPEQQYARDVRSWTGEMLPGWNEGSDAASLQRVAGASGQKGFLVSDEAGASIVAGSDMPIRSRFARFDPRLAHLRNLSAGVGGVAMLGDYLTPEQREEELRAYLGM